MNPSSTRDSSGATSPQEITCTAKQSQDQQAPGTPTTPGLPVTPIIRRLRKWPRTVMMSSGSSDDDVSEYIPTPLRLPTPRHDSPVRTVRSVKLCTIPHHCALLDMRQVDDLLDQINDTMRCRTTGCQGKFVPTTVQTWGLGGTATYVYKCTGCREMVEFQTSTRNTPLAKTDLSLATQVAFITAGCTYETYVKVLKHVLGIRVVSSRIFMKTIETLHPIVKGMVDEMCEREKNRMKAMKDDEPGSWKQAVTCADGTWMTRGFHSKNATFSIRNYYTGALLYCKHICQKGRDTIIDEELYKGTSKSAEGYSAIMLLQKAKDEGMNIAIHWQDADSSSSKSVNDIFPEAVLMICGGHAGRAHLKQLQKLAKMKTFTDTFKKMYRDQFPEVDSIKCGCSKHKAGCGCMSDAFCQRARNNFSNILSSSRSAKEFAERLQALVYHVQDIHSWDGGQCQFHALKVCNCGKCPDKNEPKCDGKDYHTREVLSCPFHLLAYEIECFVRAQMADQLVHKKLLRGHTNWLESSHNVFIRFRPKHIFLERLHYHVSTNLGLLQANMTHECNQQGPVYHWKVELLQRLHLPVYDGVKTSLMSVNKSRKKALDGFKTVKTKKRRVELKTQRTKDAQERKLWSKKHGQDTYGDDEDEEVDREEVKQGGKKVKTIKKPCKCGSTSHSRSTHKDCPLKKKNTVREDDSTQTAAKTTTTHSPERDNSQDQAITDNVLEHDEPTRIGSSSDDEADSEEENNKANSEEENEYTLISSGSELDPEAFEEVVIAGCNCGALNKAHKKTCPMNSRVRYTKNRKERKPQLNVGDYVCLHSSAVMKGMHLCCRVAEYEPGRIASLYRLVCHTGVLRGLHSEQELTSCQPATLSAISLDKWRTRSTISLKAARNDPLNLQKCECEEKAESKDKMDLTKDPSPPSQNEDKIWIKNALYTLYESNHELITSPAGWLDSDIIIASQKVLLQQFPTVNGLQPPNLEQIRGFQAHTGDFAQIINVRNNHWIFVSNIGCDASEVLVYDTMYSSIPSSTIDTIARLSFSSSPTLTIKMVNVDPQRNSSDCGVLCVAMAYEVLSQNGPSIAIYDHSQTRQHLCQCLQSSHLSPFPMLSRKPQEDLMFKNTITVELFCVCRMPEHPGEENMAECEACKGWFHDTCLNIPPEVFDEDEPWECPECENKQ